MDDKLLNKIIDLAIKAENKKCVPVGAIVIDSEKKVIGCGYNKKEKSNNPLDHAEIIAIKKACRKLKTWKLSGCSIYVTMEPCEMCKNVILESKINDVYYLLNNEKEKNKKQNLLKKLNLIKINEQMFEREYLNLIRMFFKKIRKNK